MFVKTVYIVLLLTADCMVIIQYAVSSHGCVKYIDEVQTGAKKFHSHGRLHAHGNAPTDGLRFDILWRIDNQKALPKSLKSRISDRQ